MRYCPDTLLLTCCKLKNSDKKARQALFTAEQQKSPIKLTGYKRKANFRNNNLQDIEINRKTAITILDSANFKHSTQQSNLADKKSVKDIKEHGYEKQLVSVEGFVQVNGCFQSNYNGSKFKEVYFNDKEAVITLALWNDCIDQVPESGSFTLSNITVKRPADDQKPSLATNKATVITKAKISTKCLDPGYQLYKETWFPINDFVFSAKKVSCKKCFTKVDVNPGKNFMKCSSCGVSSRYSALPIIRSARVSIGDASIMIYDSQLNQYATSNGINMEDEDKFIETILSDETTRLVVNERGVCVCML